MDTQSFCALLANDYAEKILNWAVKKTGNRESGEDLAQEVLLQVFTAASKQQHIEKPEHFLWKVAHYVWCNRLRALTKHGADELSEVLPDGTDFAADYAESEAKRAALSHMRRAIADLSRMQREMMLLHYLDGLPVREVAARLGTTESAVTWHLFNSRKQVREDISMREDNTTIYRPGKLSISYSGEAPAYPDTQKVSDSLIRQNLCLLCHSGGKTIDELAEATGVPKPFLEYDLDWLTEHEFLTLEGKRYHTTFLILNQKYFNNRIDIYQANKKNYIDVIISELWKHEDKIRGIGFYGADFPAEKLYWSIIMLFTGYCSHNSKLMLKLKSRDNYEIRPDGGKYRVTASDRSDGVQSGFSHLEPLGWNDFYGICSDVWETGKEYGSYYWLGVYNFCGEAYRPEIATANAETRAVIHNVYCKTIEPNFSADTLTLEEKEKLALAVESGLIAKEGDAYKPNFVVFTPEQLAALQSQIFAPLLAKITPQMEAMSEKFFKLHKSDFPKAAECSLDWNVYVDLWVFGIFTLMFASEEGKLALPESPQQGAPLTLVVVMSIEAYEAMLDENELDREIVLSEAQYKATGTLHDAKEALSSLKIKHFG